MNRLILSPMSIAAGVAGIGSGRLVPTVAAVVGLIGVVLGGLVLARTAGWLSTRSGRFGAISAGVAGLMSVVVGVVHTACSAGGFGTGNGLAGALAAIVLGLISLVLSGLAFSRSRLIDLSQSVAPGMDRSDRSSVASVGEDEG
jgi:hypothetical protein